MTVIWPCYQIISKTFSLKVFTTIQEKEILGKILEKYFSRTDFTTKVNLSKNIFHLNSIQSLNRYRGW